MVLSKAIHARPRLLAREVSLFQGLRTLSALVCRPHRLLPVALLLTVLLALGAVGRVEAQTASVLDDPVSQVVSGSGHTCTLSATGVVRCWGYNQYGQLGDNVTAFSRLSPAEVGGLAGGVVALTAGTDHTCALLVGGAVKCWGRNIAGQLGDGSTTDRYAPVDVVGLGSDVAAIDSGGFSTCALTTAGAVKCWGSNAFGQVGDGSTTDRPAPVDVVSLSGGAAAISVGGSHACALSQTGAVQCWGNNIAGELGDGTTTNRSVPVAVVGLGSGVASLSLGNYHSCALLVSGGVQCWGPNDRGQLGDGSTVNSPVPVAVSGLGSGVSGIGAGFYHTCALIAGGTMKCWGYNQFGGLGDGSSTTRTAPVAVVGLSGVAAVSPGSLHTCVLLELGDVKCWGYNFFGQTGNGSTSQSLVPANVAWHTVGVVSVGAGAYHSCAVTLGGAARCWGANDSGQLGDNTTTQRSSAIAVVGLDSGVAVISTGAFHSCALTVGGGVWCWGRNSDGQLGNNSMTDSTVPVAVSGLGSGVAAISAGGYHTCARTTTGAMKCWGLNSSGQIGDNSTTTRLTPADVNGLGSGVSAISAGALHTCALAGGAAKCWGYNFWGTVGDNSTTQRQVPTAVSGLGSGVAAISAGVLHTCALIAGGVKCWGYNATGQLGDNSTTQRLTPVDVVSLGGVATSVVTAESHTCALIAGGGVRCWGDNSAGQLGDNSNTQRLTPVDVNALAGATVLASAQGAHSCALSAAGVVKCWGRNGNGQVGDSSTSNRRTAVAIRSAQSIAFAPATSIVVATTSMLAASATGGMPVVFDSWTPSTCGVSATTLTIGGAVGSLCGVRASQVTAPLSAGGSLAPAPQQLRLLQIVVPPPILDIDSSAPATKYDAATDGVLLLRYLLGYRGVALTAGATSASAQRDAAQIAGHIAGNLGRFDVDGDGKTLALTDGVMILRRLLGIVTPAAVTQGLKNSARSDADVVLAIDALKP